MRKKPPRDPRYPKRRRRIPAERLLGLGVAAVYVLSVGAGFYYLPPAPALLLLALVLLGPLSYDRFASLARRATRARDLRRLGYIGVSFREIGAFESRAAIPSLALYYASMKLRGLGGAIRQPEPIDLLPPRDELAVTPLWRDGDLVESLLAAVALRNEARWRDLLPILEQRGWGLDWTHLEFSRVVGRAESLASGLAGGATAAQVLERLPRRLDLDKPPDIEELDRAILKAAKTWALETEGGAVR